MQHVATKPIKIFLTGATGYIGGTVLSKLLDPSQAGKWEITALIRSQNNAPKLKELGVTPLIGSLDDADILIQAASEADVVLDLADSDHVKGIQALVKGCAKPREDGKRTIYIHCSGTGELADDARGNYSSDEIYNDFDMKKIHSIPLTRLHRDVDSYIFDHLEGFDSIIVAPPAIYGIGTGPFNRLSIQVPTMIRTFLKYGSAATIGKGVNIWDGVHVEDLADFFMLVLEKSLEGKAHTGYDGWYFCESGNYIMKDIVAKIASELYKHKAIKQAEIGEFTPEEVEKYYGKFGWNAIGSNSRSRAEKARSLGWTPKRERGTVFDHIEAEVLAVLAEQNKAIN